MLELPFEDASFDAVVEKGSMDVLFVDNDSSWDPSPPVRGRVSRLLQGVHRCVYSLVALLSGGLHS
jgi:EEF1A lysine methyltransferase 4